ncbi:hypothetical protein [Cetobacterium sp.]
MDEFLDSLEKLNQKLEDIGIGEKEIIIKSFIENYNKIISN